MKLVTSCLRQTESTVAGAYRLRLMQGRKQRVSPAWRVEGASS